MKCFIAGGTGVLGKRLVALLIDNGHEVGVLSRSKEKSEFISSLGAIPIEVNLFDKAKLIEATSGYEIFIHTATSIPKKSKVQPTDWEMNSKIRIEGTQNLISAAQTHKAKLYIQQSIIFHYGHRNGDWVDEDTEITNPYPVYTKPNKSWQKVNNITLEMENIVTNAMKHFHLPAVILRCGWFYSHDSSNLSFIADGGMPIVGGGNAFWNMITIDDAAQAFYLAVSNYQKVAGATINIVDDEPVKIKDFITFATQSNGKHPKKINPYMYKLIKGNQSLNFVMNSVRVKNIKAKSLLEWKPKYPTYKEGIVHELSLLMQNKGNLM
ncbi:MAG: NAD(P)-dependent oxidoreductase [Candidatus Heimdallarchaeota archaeon]|nr:NAD(P)-dependent oxidoreductase [Candidatus Heimdallarchaeota archaeon]MDH5645118.1 NAD(P)-dependent oxidoreductase [Candidatus Heimdallarchaeota archaeon]